MQGKPRALSDFIGTWQLSRQITHADGAQASFAGIARWDPCDGGALYKETGTLHIAGQAPLTGSRTYRWSDALEVSFEDGRFFHSVPSMGGETSHWCDPDSYRVVYDFTKWPEFTMIWAVRGPRKDYQMVSGYRRAEIA